LTDFGGESDFSRCDFRYCVNSKHIQHSASSELHRRPAVAALDHLDDSVAEIGRTEGVHPRVQAGVDVGHPERGRVEVLGNDVRVGQTHVEDEVERHPTDQRKRGSTNRAIAKDFLLFFSAVGEQLAKTTNPERGPTDQQKRASTNKAIAKDFLLFFSAVAE